MAREQYMRQVGLLVRTLPFIARYDAFALKGGTAINLFYRDMPRLSVDIDLTYLPIEDRETTLKNIDIGRAFRRPGDDHSSFGQVTRDFGAAAVVTSTEGQLSPGKAPVPNRPDRAAMAVEAGDRHLGDHQCGRSRTGQDANLGLFAEKHFGRTIGAGQPDAALLVYPVAFDADAGNGAVELGRRV